jgi:hypothetical protein
MSNLKTDFIFNGKSFAVIGIDDSNFLLMSVEMHLNNNLWAHSFITVSKSSSQLVTVNDGMNCIQKFIDVGYEMLVTPELLGFRSDLWTVKDFTK